MTDQQKTAAEHAEERSTALAEQYRTEFDESQQAAIDARADQPDTAETDEEYAERIRLASSTGLFGNVETTYGVQAAGANPTVHDPVAGTKAVAAADANAEQGGEPLDPEAAFAQTDPRVPSDSWGSTEAAPVEGQTAPSTTAAQAVTPDLSEEEQEEADNLAQPADEPDPDAPHGETVSEDNAPAADTEENAADGAAAGEEQQ